MLLGLGALALLAGAALMLRQPSLPWAGEEPRPQSGVTTRETDPGDTVPGPILLIGLEPEADAAEVLADVGVEPVTVDESTTPGLRSVAFEDEGARDRARRRLADHQAVRVLHQPEALRLNDGPTRTEAGKAGS